ncbi:MAG TPA: hypothetical protein VKH46_12135 [Thermoanaerobaculia bacterium]|nr:hypothetical protein [Thermoanaerobaculia bacterium]
MARLPEVSTSAKFVRTSSPPFWSTPWIVALSPGPIDSSFGIAAAENPCVAPIPAPAESLKILSVARISPSAVILAAPRASPRPSLFVTTLS